MTPNLSLGFSKSDWITCMLSIAYEKWHQWFIKTRKDKIQRLCGTQIVYLDENLCIVLANVCCHVWWLLGKHFAQPGRDFSLHLTEQCSGGRTKHRVLFQERVPWKKGEGPFKVELINTASIIFDVKEILKGFNFKYDVSSCKENNYMYFCSISHNENL